MHDVEAQKGMGTMDGRRLQGKVCLIVDDDPAFCEIAAETIRREKGRPVIRTGGVAALEYLEEGPCDLVVIDLIMPQIDGFRLISLIRHMPNLRCLPIAIVTARLDEEARVEATRLGVESFMTKPIRWADFAGNLAEIVKVTAERDSCRGYSSMNSDRA